MTLAFLNEGAVSFAAANWSDAIGITNGAELIVDKPFGKISSDLDFSTKNIKSLEFTRTSVGTVGGDGSGNLKVGVNFGGTGADYLAIHGNNEVYFEVPVGATCANLDVSNGRVYSQGGTILTYTHSGGWGEVNASTKINEMYIYGGSGIIHYNAQKFTKLYIYGGQWIVKRLATDMFIGDRANVILDLDQSANYSGTSLEMNGGSADIRYAPIPTVNAQGGLLNFRSASRPFVFGSTTLFVGGARIIENSFVDLSNIEYPGVLSRSRVISGLESAGGFVPLSR